MRLLSCLMAMLFALVVTACGGGGGASGTASGSKPLVLSTTAPSSLTLAVGSTGTYQIVGGVAPYTASSTDVQIVKGAVSGASLTITPVKAGTASLQVFDAQGTSVVIGLTIVGLSGSSAVASIEVLPTTSSLSSAAGSTIGFLVTVKDALNTTIPNQTVTFSASSGNLTGANPSPVTGTSGTISTVSLSTGTDASNRTIVVTAAVGAVSKSISIPVVGTTVAISGPGSTLLGTSGLAYTLKAADSGGKPVAGAVLNVASKLGNAVNPPTVTTDVSGAAVFSYVATVAGTDTLKVTGLGVTSQTTVNISNEDFSFATPDPGVNLNVNTVYPVKVRYRVNGVGVAGQTVNFSSTRGTVSAASAVTDVLGEAVTSISSSTAGPVTLSAQLAAPSTARTTLTGAFVATVPATVLLQANPGALFPNVGGSAANQATLSATVRDAAGNPVFGQGVDFTAVSDLSNGYITPGSATTDSNGIANAQFVPGALSTPANGVVIKATVQGTSITSTVSLTVNGSALFISMGMSNDLTVVDRNTYAKGFSVYVTDANGAPVANKAVTLSVYPPNYGKGQLTYDLGLSLWVYAGAAPTKCANEDLNRNGILDAGEDTNGDGRLTPGLPVVLQPATVTTDANGYSTFLLNYGKNYAYWLDTQIIARASVGGTESSKAINFALAMLADDAKSPSSPANQVSPFGMATSCSNPN